MAVLFAKTFVHAGQQLVVQRRILPIVCVCGRPSCKGTMAAHGITCTTMVSGSEEDIILPLLGIDNTAASAQQLVDLFEQADAVEALEILQANHYQVDSLEESQERLLALRASLLTRIPVQS